MTTFQILIFKHWHLKLMIIFIEMLKTYQNSVGYFNNENGINDNEKKCRYSFIDTASDIHQLSFIR